MTESTKNELKIEIIQGERLSSIQRENIITLCNRAYEEDLGALFDTFAEATHVLGYDSASLACHALWVTRFLQVGRRKCTGPMPSVMACCSAPAPTRTALPSRR